MIYATLCKGFYYIFVKLFIQNIAYSHPLYALSDIVTFGILTIYEQVSK